MIWIFLVFKSYKDDNFIKVYPVVCPHEGGFLGLNNKIGVKNTLQKFKKMNAKYCVIFIIENLSQLFLSI